MHFSIPDTQELNSENGSRYIGYNIHINGVYHCTVRYKQLLNLHEQLRRKCAVNLPSFPPKKFLPLTSSQLMERRIQLEKYIQAIGQEPRILSTNILNSFLRSAQHESLGCKVEETNMDVYLMNGYQIHVSIMTTDHTSHVLNKVCQQMNLPQEYVDYFALFVVRRNETGDIAILRKLEDFESPYLSQKTATNNKRDETQRICLRKMFWDCDFDMELMCHPVSLNLLYVQTVSDVERGWIICTKSVLAQLAALQSRGAKQQYLELAKTLKYYGYMQFGYAVTDYPQPDTRVIIAIGKRELSMRLPSATEYNTREGCFKVTRMRCWRITTVRKNSDECDSNSEPELELSFEYLLSKDKLRWINISSPQAIFMSTCLQSIVDELLLKKNGIQNKDNFSKEDNSSKSAAGSWSYMKRDGTLSVIDFNSTSNGIASDITTPRSSQQWSEPFSIKKLQEKFSSSSSTSTNHRVAASTISASGNEFIENDAFEDIGDEDL